MGVVSDASIGKRIVPEDERDKARRWFQKRDWPMIGERILIDPFDERCLGPFSYDLHVGEEAFLVNQSKKVPIPESGFVCEPGEMVLLLSREFLGIPRTLAATILPRFSLVRRGLLLSMTKIDPTWYGRIAVASINQSKTSIRMDMNQPFCTLVFHVLSEPCHTVLSTKQNHALGKETIGPFVEETRQE